MTSDRKLEIARVTVDERCETTFEIPKNWLTRTSHLFARQYAYLDNNSTFTNASDPRGIYLPKIYTSHFFDFQHWLRENKIIKTLHMYTPYALEHNARRLVDALALGVSLETEELQLAAMKEFLSIAKFLEWPEDFVNSIFAVPQNFANGPAFRALSAADRARIVHPARRMIVAVVAAKTIGKGKRKVRTGPRDKGIERGDRIEGMEFWQMFDEFVKQRIRGGEIAWPEKVEEFL